MNLIQLIADYSTIIGWIFAGAAFVFMLYMRAKFVPREDHDKLKSAFDAAVKRIDIIELKLENLPDSMDIQNLALQINSLEGELKSVTTKFEAISKYLDLFQDQVNRMEEFLKRKM